MSIATNPSSNKGRLLPADLPPGSVITPQTPNHTFRTAQKGLGNQVIPRIIPSFSCARSSSCPSTG